ncbi:MAG: hypothetical protein A2Z91_01540 [Deltaproteobacteria bacterium GWA2_38_16]|nr:MAG: hypothetical protein A2Z91_01540 [Deltaproteobacteria bacterium GWA2_38_16]OGQ03304.1 MAG: hypothetical protein A3D19_00145 [Deltaproteobacteria bacterium RIFCSPHIGHO2_02_FULL_38_15]OGQ30467.1 MAG: hypothetical protein A3A72_08750 [Deltaproteobacteria bacterium RIFCSPLOWO2_01_FULL_38_9]OGQ63176.1 MAG: hypothetical protein A3G92_03775 [Deltaproteobacteria bacterium RIFCSPLOWO2_12_FULL_38_8]
MTYDPLFQMTPQIIKYLGKIEAAKEIVDTLTLPLSLEKEFRQEASFKMAHYSTKIEGNRLTLKQTKELLTGKDIIARQIDKLEVRNYYHCLEWIYRMCHSRVPFSEQWIKVIHGLIQKDIVEGKLRGQYREAQNAIYDSQTNKAVYFPPESKDVHLLMKSLVKWLNQKNDTHPILKAGIAHYQLVSIHPFMDGNGRTARALATFLLYREKYDLKQLYSLENYYSEDLKGYYAALHECQGLHYYENSSPNITRWLDYFSKGVAIVFEEIKEKTLLAIQKYSFPENKANIKLLQSITPRQRKVLTYFSHHPQVRTKNISSLFHIKDRTARDLLTKWIQEGFIKRQGQGKKDSYYVLSETYWHLIDKNVE